jgi:hypothetical protein
MQGGRPSNGRYPERPFQVKVGTPGIDQRLHALQIVRQPLINIKNPSSDRMSAPPGLAFRQSRIGEQNSVFYVAARSETPLNSHMNRAVILGPVSNAQKARSAMD